MAGFELWRRQFEVSERPIIDSPEKAVEQLSDIRDKKQEYFVCLTLDGANRLIAKRIITIGTLTASLVHPREVFAEAITDRAASIIVAQIIKRQPGAKSNRCWHNNNSMKPAQYSSYLE